MFSDNPLFKTLIDWINFIWLAIPVRLRPSMLELLFGAMICKKGHITTALLAIRYKLSWTSYFKVIEKGRYCWLAIAKQWFKLILLVLAKQHLVVAIDDFLTPRASKKAPSVGLHYDHAKRANRPKFIWGQMRVSLAVIGSKGQKTVALPLLLRLMRTFGNRNKLNAAWLLIKVLLHWKPKDLQTTVLMDAWYMKANLVLKLIKERISVIGQVRKDTALYLPPVEPDAKRPGRPRKYGLKITLANICQLCPVQQSWISAYDKKRLFQIYSLSVKVRFLKGCICKIAWCRFINDKSIWTQWHLLVSTDCTLDAQTIVQTYALRWWTEPLFNELKNLFGLKDAWEQTRQVLARWTMILCMAYGLPRLLSLCFDADTVKSLFSIPWRNRRPITAGWIAEMIRFHFHRFPIRALWDRKLKKIRLSQAPIGYYFDNAA